VRTPRAVSSPQLTLNKKSFELRRMLDKMAAVMVHCKKRLAIFPALAGMSLNKLSLAGNNLIFSGQEEFGY
jgi:hypothetical protein